MGHSARMNTSLDAEVDQNAFISETGKCHHRKFTRTSKFWEGWATPLLPFVINYRQYTEP